MNIKIKSLLFPLSSFLFSLLLSSCDNIDEADRLIYEAPPTVNRSVLIEDFTGQRCVNCPNAADEIHSLQQEYGEEHVIAVGIHGGPMAVKPNPSRPSIIGLATDLGDAYNEYWKVEAWPSGMVNRQGLTNYTDWKAQVRAELQKTAPVNIEADFTAAYGDEIDGASIVVTVEGAQGTTTGKLQVWIIEDNITAIQLLPDGSADSEYLHQHVFRTTVNGDWGEDITVAEGAQVNKIYGISLPIEWNHTNLSAVVFVYNDTQGVLQVVREPLRMVQIIE